MIEAMYGEKSLNFRGDSFRIPALLMFFCVIIQVLQKSD
jgi:hypothetical protein